MGLRAEQCLTSAPHAEQGLGLRAEHVFCERTPSRAKLYFESPVQSNYSLKLETLFLGKHYKRARDIFQPVVWGTNPE